VCCSAGCPDCLLDTQLHRQPLDVRGTADDAGRLALMFGAIRLNAPQSASSSDSQEPNTTSPTSSAAEQSTSDEVSPLQVLQDGAHRRYVVHVHGIHFRPKGFVLTPDEYHATSDELHRLMTRWIDGDFIVQSEKQTAESSHAAATASQHVSPPVSSSAPKLHLHTGRASIILVGCGSGAFDPHLMRLWHHLKLLAAKQKRDESAAASTNATVDNSTPLAFLLCDGDGASWRLEVARHGLSQVLLVVPYGDHSQLPEFLEQLQQHAPSKDQQHPARSAKSNVSPAVNAPSSSNSASQPIEIRMVEN
jgi:hypothetical protein